MTFTERFDKLLKEKNLSKTDVANNCKISNATISMWYKGFKPNGTTLNKLSEYFKVSTDYLLGKEDIKYKIQEKQLTEEQTELILKFEQADEPEKIIIKKLLHIK